MKNKVINILFALLLLIKATMGAPIQVGEVQIHGAALADKSDVLKWLGINDGDQLEPDQLQEKAQALLKGYTAHHMPFTRIDSLVYDITADSSIINIAVFINEGRKLESGEINLQGMSEQNKQLVLKRFNSRPGREWDGSRLEADLDDAIVQLEKQGYPFTRIDLQSIRLDSVSKDHNQIDLDLNMARGPKLIIDEIQIIGNDLTMDHVILRELRIKPGSVFDYDKVSKIRPRLMRLGYFEQVSEPEVFVADRNRGGLLLRVQEGRSSRFDGILGYNPGTDTEKGYFTGLIDVSLGNLMGTGRSLQAHWQKRDRKSQDLKFHYREPWILGYPVHAGFGFQQLIQDTTYIQRDIGLDVVMPLLEGLDLEGNINSNSITPDSLGSYVLGIPRSRTRSAEIGIRYDARDDLLNPRSGVFYATSVETGSKKNLGPDEVLRQYQLDKHVSIRRLSLDMELYLPLFRRQVLATSLHGRQIKSTEQFIPIPDLYRLGGTNSLRGFREDQFRGSSIAWINLEYRYILGRRSRAFIFTDIGYYTADNTYGKNEEYKTGYGFGFRLETGLGIMGVDYGLGRGEETGLFGGLLHVRLINEF